MTATAPAVQPPSRPRRSAGRRSTTWLGWGLIIAGVVMLGWFAWQYFGTNIVSKHQQEQITRSTVTQWEAGSDGDAVALLRVERFGPDFEVPVLSGFGDDVLAKGVGMNPAGAGPGEQGNFAVAGHRVTHGEPFRDFLELRAGDEVEIETRTQIFTYRLENDGDEITVDFSTGWPLWGVPNPDAEGKEPDRSYLTMLTCSELFHTDDRNVVVGELVQTIDKATEAPPTPEE